MANTLTKSSVTLYNALDVVSREMTGMIGSVTLDATYERAAVGQTVRSPVAPASTAGDITPAVTPPNDGDQTIGNVSMTISKARRVPVRWNGEEQRLLDNNGASYNVILRDQFAQAMRTLVNEMETDLTGLYVGASRAHGAAGTAHFNTANDLGDFAGPLRILEDNGAQGLDLQYVLGSAAWQNLRSKQAVLFKVNESGREDMLRNGVTDRVMGFALRNSAQVRTHTAGSFSSGTLTSAVRAAGSTSLVTTADYSAGLGAGDVITLAHESDAHKYVVVSVSAGAIVIAAPGLRTATAATGTVAITKVATSSRNMAFARSAIAMAVRAPALPGGGDMADDRMFVTDPYTGITFEVSLYKQYRQIQYEVAIAWGQAVIKTEHIALAIA